MLEPPSFSFFHKHFLPSHSIHFSINTIFSWQVVDYSTLLRATELTLSSWVGLMAFVQSPQAKVSLFLAIDTVPSIDREL